MAKRTGLLHDKYEPEPMSGCWLWTAFVEKTGYGKYNPGKRRGGGQWAHRAVYQSLVGPIPFGMDLDHLCRNRQCVNPAHLEVVTRRENLRRGPTFRGARTRCPYGHPYDQRNTILNKGKRNCRACRDMRNLARYRWSA